MATTRQTLEDPDALARCAWVEAREHFEAARERGVCAAAEEGLSWAAWWLGGEELTLSAVDHDQRPVRQVVVHELRFAERRELIVTTHHDEHRDGSPRQNFEIDGAVGAAPERRRGTLRR